MFDLNGADEEGNTALHMAAMYGHEALVQLILEQGSALQPNAVDSDNTTPFMLACARGHLSIAHMLVKAGAKVHLTDRLGWSALHHAAAGGHSLIVHWLVVQKGVNPYARDASGCSPLWLALSAEDADSVRCLLLNGADPDEINSEDVSTHDLAKEADDPVFLQMIELASDAWAEVRGWDDDPREEREIKDKRVLEGKNAPQLPVSEELDEEDLEDLGASPTEERLARMRQQVRRTLAMEEAFVESHLRVQVNPV